MKRSFICDLIEKPISGEWGIEPTNGHAIGVIRNANFTNEGVLDLSDIAYREISAKKIAQKSLKRGDIIIEKSGGSPTQPVGRVVYYDRPDGEMMFSNFTAAIRAKAGVDPRFLYYMLWATHLFKTTQAYQNKTTGIANLQLTRYIEEVEIPSPPLPTQRRIAAILDKAQALVANDRRTLAVYDQLAKSLFLEMFGDPVRNERGWETVEVADIGNARLGKMLDAKKQTGNNLRKYLRNTNVQWRHIELHDLHEMDFDEKDRKKFELLKGDILMCEGGEVGRCAIWKGEHEECYFQKALHRIRLNAHQVLPEFFVYLFKELVERNGLKDYVSTSTISHLTGEKLASVRIPVPPIKQQRMFDKAIEALDQQRGTTEASLLRSEGLFGSLLQGAFRGELGGGTD
ncbi:MAG: restriction endonuclease subunit S [Flavobacteriales bacterium]